MDISLNEAFDYLFITEVGSYMWGMATETSDRDLFVCYQTPASHYLKTMDFNETRPQRHYAVNGIDHDVQYMEIGHLIKLLMKGNANAIWAVCSPIIHKNNGILMPLRQMVANNLSLASYNSIRGLATSNFMDMEKRRSVRSPQKSLNSCFRTLQFGITMFEEHRVKFSPIGEDATVEACVTAFNVLDYAVKTSTLPAYPRTDIFEDFIFDLRLREIRGYLQTV